MDTDETVDYNRAWEAIKRTFPILHDNFTLPLNLTTSEEEFYQVVRLIIDLDIVELIQTLITSKIEKYSRDHIAVKFWSYFRDISDENEGFRQFHNAIMGLYENYMHFHVLALKLELLRCAAKCDAPIYGERNATNALKLIIRSALLSQVPLNCNPVIKNFYDVALKNEENEEPFVDQCAVCLCGTECHCSMYFHETNSILIEMGLLESMVQQTLTTVIYDFIENYIERTCKDHFDIPCLNTLQKRLEEVMNKWLRKVYSCEAKTVLNDSVAKVNRKLVTFIYDTYTKLRVNQLFNIIIEYPDSIPALEDLRVCLPKTDLRSYLIKKLQKSMETRLLHPGVGTQDVLTAYVATIRSMRVLDPSGLLLETITQPIHQYLRSREDTVRCVVSSLTEEGPNDLAEELVKGEAVQTDEHVSSDDEEQSWDVWMPDPVEANPNKNVNMRRTTDIISMLVNVYGSKELFVNEYRTLLADRLLTSLSCDTEKEFRYLELLKLRFGDAQLHFCEVMLKDIVDSKRINQHIRQDANYTRSADGEDSSPCIPMSSMILSAQFWPAFKEEKCELHPTVNERIAAHTKAFETLKGNRTLCWKKHLGLVDLDIELDDGRTVSFTSVAPMHATIIMHFQDKGNWSLDELARVMHIPPTLLKRKISFWQSHGLITETTPNVFQLVENTKGETSQTATDIIIEDESESAMASTQDQREEELQTIWSYIVGMLMNLDSLNLERIHQMLKMFAFQVPTVECNVQELRHFLDRKVRDHQLVYSGGAYRLPKP